MTISVRITQSEAPKRVERGGFLAALTGPVGYEPGGSTEVVIDSDQHEGRKAAGVFLAQAAPLAADTFRTAVLGERFSEGVVGWSDEPAGITFEEGAITIVNADSQEKPEEEPTPESVSQVGTVTFLTHGYVLSGNVPRHRVVELLNDMDAAARALENEDGQS